METIWHIIIQLYNHIDISYYIYIYIGIVWLRVPNESRPFHSSWTRTLLEERVKRAQLLWIVHNFLQTWTASTNSMTSSQTLQRALNQTLPYIYICNTNYAIIPHNPTIWWMGWRENLNRKSLIFPLNMGDFWSKFCQPSH